MHESLILLPFSKKIPAFPPVWLMRQAGRSLPEYLKVRNNFKDFMEFCLNPEAVCDVTLQPLHRFDVDAAILFSDILVLPYACGQDVSFVKNQGPVLSPFHLETFLSQSIETLLPVLNPVLKAIGLIKSNLPKTKGLIGFAGAPWTVALYMLEGGSSKDFHRAKRYTFENLDRFQKLLEHLTYLTMAYLELQIQAGVHLIQLFESWAGLVPSAFLEPWVFQPTRLIRDFLKKRHPTVPLIGFPKGLGTSALKAFQTATQVDGLSVDFSVGLEELHDVPCVIQGNLDPSILLTGGAVLHQETQRICQAMKEKPFVFNLGHGVLPETPLEHIAELVKQIRQS